MRRQVRLRQKSRVVAYRDFGRKFEFIAGDFKPTAYYAECVDLIRKLVLSGLIGLINPGTVFQSFCSVIFSLAFMVTHATGCSSCHRDPDPYPALETIARKRGSLMKDDRFDRETSAWTHRFECGPQVIHIKIWPYPSTSSNALKFFADAQLFLVTLADPLA